jgi:predicted Zn-dependent protease
LTRLESVEKRVETRRAVKIEKSPAVSSKSSPALNPENNITPKTSRACSRKRVQARKGSSLSAMLAKSKQDATSSNSGFGFDLMDLMKST